LYIFAGKAIFSLQQDTFSGVATHSMYLWHYLIPIFAGINLFLLIHFVQKNIDKKSEIFQYAAWLFTFLSILILSNEIVHTWAFVNYEAGSDLLIIRTKAIKIALPILWSVCSLILMLIGMKLKVKTYRIISLSLFTLTIIKLFVYDISNVGQGGKIAAFIILGVILLVVSFLYQKIKGLFIDQENDEQNKLDD
jgi:uncharacterized membrane protein